MSVKEALTEMENGISQKRQAISLLHCLGKAMRQDEVLLPNMDEAVLGVCEFLGYLLEKDETALENAFLAVCGEK